MARREAQNAKAITRIFLAKSEWAELDAMREHGQFTDILRNAESCVRRKVLKDMVRPGGLELPTFWFVARRSIQLSYGRTVIQIS